VALHFAAEKGHVGCAKRLLEHKAVVNVSDDWGETPLIKAAAAGAECGDDCRRVDVISLLQPRVDEWKGESLLVLVEREGGGGGRLQLLGTGIAGLHPPRSEIPQRPRESQSACHRELQPALRYVTLCCVTSHACANLLP